MTTDSQPRRKISLAEHFKFDSFWENKSEAKPSETMATLNTPVLIGPRSKSMSDILDDVDRFSEKSRQSPNISRDHWLKGKVLQKCRGCRRQINLVFKRHHCRLCGDIFCQSCSRYRRRLNDCASPDNHGYLHRVCLFCISRPEDAVQPLGPSRSWTQEYLEMRAQHRENIGLNLHEPSDELECEVPAVCLLIINQCVDAVPKSKSKVVRKKIYNAMKAAKRDMSCCSCNRSLIIPSDRKECSVCDAVSCKKCSSKDLVLYWPRGTETTDETKQPHIEIMSDDKDITEKADVWRKYRVCDPCRVHLDHVMNEYVFNLDLQSIHSELTSLQLNISTKLDEVSSNPWNRRSSVNILDSDLTDFTVVSKSRSYSTDCLLFDDNSTDVPEDSDDEVLDKLFGQYWRCHRQLANLKPETNTQRIIVKNILSAAMMFYIEKRRRCRVLIETEKSEEQLDS